MVWKTQSLSNTFQKIKQQWWDSLYQLPFQQIKNHKPGTKYKNQLLGKALESNQKQVQTGGEIILEWKEQYYVRFELCLFCESFLVSAKSHTRFCSTIDSENQRKEFDLSHWQESEKEILN